MQSGTKWRLPQSEVMAGAKIMRRGDLIRRSWISRKNFDNVHEKHEKQEILFQELKLCEVTTISDSKI